MGGTPPVRLSRGAWRVCVALLLALQLVLAVGVARHAGCTTDEHHYFNSGRILARHGFAHVGTVLQGPLPLRANQLLVGEFPAGGFDAEKPGAEALLLRGRLGTLLFVLPASLVVLLWSRRLFGELGALFSLAALVLHPLWLAYSGTLLVDAQAASVLLAALAALALHLERPGPGRLLAFAALAAAAVATKYLALLALVPAALLALGASVRAAPRGRRCVAALVASCVAGGGGLLVLHALYGFGAEYLAGFAPRSALVSGLLEQRVGRFALAWLPGPLVAGLDFQLAQGERSWRVFLDGELLAGTPRYYVAVFLYRTPELLLALGALALTQLGRARPRADLVALLVPLGVLLAWLSCCTSMQLGVRYALSLVPASCLLLGALGAVPALALRPARGLACLALLVLGGLLELARNGTDWLGYFNAASGGQALAHRHLRDTNVDFGQHQPRVRDWLARVAPDAHVLGRPGAARFGRVAVRVGEFRGPDSAWAFEGEPLARLGAAWCLFEVTRAGLAARAAAEGGGALRRALVVALLDAGELEAARQEARALAFTRGDPLRRLLLEPDPLAQRHASLWYRLGFREPARSGAQPGELELLRAQRLRSGGDARAALLVLGRERIAERAAYFALLE